MPAHGRNPVPRALRCQIFLGENLTRFAVKVSDKANFTVSDADVPNPKPGDSIIYNGQRWNVNAVYLKDSLAGNTTLSASKAERSGLR